MARAESGAALLLPDGSRRERSRRTDPRAPAVPRNAPRRRTGYRRWCVPLYRGTSRADTILVGENKRRLSARSASGMQMVAFALWVIGGDFSDFWRTGVDPLAIAAGVLAVTAPVVMMFGLLSAVVRRRDRGPRWYALSLPLAQGGWASLVAGVAFSGSSFAIAETPGWGLAVLAFGVAAALLIAAWLVEDGIVRSRAT